MQEIYSDNVAAVARVHERAFPRVVLALACHADHQRSARLAGFVKLVIAQIKDAVKAFNRQDAGRQDDEYTPDLHERVAVSALRSEVTFDPPTRKQVYLAVIGVLRRLASEPAKSNVGIVEDYQRSWGLRVTGRVSAVLANRIAGDLVKNPAPYQMIRGDIPNWAEALFPRAPAEPKNSRSLLEDAMRNLNKTAAWTRVMASTDKDIEAFDTREEDGSVAVLLRTDNQLRTEFWKDGSTLGEPLNGTEALAAIEAISRARC